MCNKPQGYYLSQIETEVDYPMSFDDDSDRTTIIPIDNAIATSEIPSESADTQGNVNINQVMTVD